MCGIISVFGFSEIGLNKLKQSLESIRYRGPDYLGYSTDSNSFMGHVRLSILDLESRSNQPFKTKDLELVYNGEIYNYKELKDELKMDSVKFNTSSDTEVLFEGYRKYGVNFFDKLRGMFAFVFYDKQQNKIIACRDPFGIKPLYYYKSDKGIIFSSQVSSIFELLGNKVHLSNWFETDFTNFGTIQEPKTIVSDTLALRPGEIIEYSIETKSLKTLKSKSIAEYFNAKQTKLKKVELLKIIENTLEESVKKHTVSDVPIGLFLSGGLDSAYLAVTLKKIGIKNLTAITISFKEFKNHPQNEINRAIQIANELKINHFEYMVTKDEFLNDLDDIIRKMDQPSIDGINTYYASKAAKKCNLKVVLSGCGGDEMLSGYTFYHNYDIIKNIINLFPKFILDSSQKLLNLFFSNPKFQNVLQSFKHPVDYWLVRRSLNYNDDLIKDFSHLKNKFKYQNSSVLQFMDISYYLKNQLLKDSDWASMAHSVELRTPFVDIDLLTKLSPYIVQISRIGKQNILSKILENKLSKNILKSKKTGFAIPIKIWLNEIEESSYIKFIKKQFESKKLYK